MERIIKMLINGQNWQMDIGEKMKRKSYKPGPGAYGSIRIAILDDDDKKYYEANSLFLDMKRANRIAIYGNELWCRAGDYYIINKYGESLW